jgi:hypothetical protein
VAAGAVTPPEGFVLEGEPPPAAAQGGAGAAPVAPAGFVLEAAPSPAGPVSEAVRAKIAGPLGRKTAQAAAEIARQMDPGVDYSGVADPFIRAQYSFLDTPEEKTKFLRDKYGAENVSQDSFGRDVVTIRGRQIAFLPRGGKDSGKEGSASSAWGDVAGEVLPTAGMVGGAILAAPANILTGPVPVASIVGSGIGGAVGKSGNKLVKQAMGANLQSSEETAKDIVTEVPKGMAAEGVARAVNLLGRSALGPFRPDAIFGPWSESAKARWGEQMEAVDAAREMGLKPKIGTVAPAAGLTQRVQNAGFRLFGDDLAFKNRPILEATAEALSGGRATPMGPQETDALNHAIVRRVDAAISDAEAQASTAISDAEQALGAKMDAIGQRVGAPQAGLSAQVSKDIGAAKDVFQERASRLYAPIDALAGKPVVPTEGIKEEMRKIISEGPKKADGTPALASDTIKKFAADIEQLAPHASFQEMQIMRSTFADRSALDALNAGLSQGQAKRLWLASDKAFDDAISNLSGPNAQAAVNALRRADRFYAAGMKRFSNLNVEALYKDATERGAVSADNVANYIAQPGMAEKFSKIAKTLSPQTLSNVGAVRWQEMVSQARDPVSGDISGRRLVRIFDDMGPVLDKLYGGTEAERMRKAASQFAALGGHIEALPAASGEPLDAAIRSAVEKQAETDAFMKRNFVQALRSEGPMSLKAAQWLTEPDNRLLLRQALSEIGPGTPEGQGLKEYLARKIFSSMQVGASRGAERHGSFELMGEPLQRELNRYGRPYLNEVFGQGWTEEAYKFAHAAEVATRKNPVDSGGLAAATVGLHWIRNLGEVMRYLTVGELLQSESMMTYLSRGVQNEGANFLARWMGQITRATTAAGAEHLPKQAAEETRGYHNRLNRAVSDSQLERAANGAFGR